MDGQDANSWKSLIPVLVLHVIALHGLYFRPQVPTGKRCILSTSAVIPARGTAFAHHRTFLPRGVFIQAKKGGTTALEFISNGGREPLLLTNRIAHGSYAGPPTSRSLSGPSGSWFHDRTLRDPPLPTNRPELQ